MKRIISSMLLIVVLFIVALIVIFAWKGSNKTVNNLTVQNDLQNYGVEIVSATDENFNDELTSYVGNYNAVNPLVEAAKPFAIFVKNNSVKEIVGVSLRWEFTKPNGEIIQASQIESSPGILMGMKPRDPFIIGKTSLINSNSLKFFTYFQGIGEELLNAFKSNRSKRFRYHLGSEETQHYISGIESQKKAVLKDISNVSVVIDAVIFNDGTFIGENKSFFFESMNGRLQARRDFLKKLRENYQSRKSDTENLNESISNIKSINTEKLSALNYLNGNDAFKQSYERYMASLDSEIKSKRLRAKDDFIVKDFLEAKDSEFIELKRK